MPYYCNYPPIHRNLSNFFFYLCDFGGPVDSETSLTLLSSIHTVRSCRLLKHFDSAIVWSNREVLLIVETPLTLLSFRHYVCTCTVEQSRL